MNTQELIDHVKAANGETVEAALLLKFNSQSTHYLCWWKHRLEDRGCDGERRITSAKRFLEWYPNCNWTL